jgi:hypothetical protein
VVLSRLCCQQWSCIFCHITVVFVILELVFSDRLVVPYGGLFSVTIVVVIFELVFFGRLVVPCGEFFIATVVVVVFKLVFFGRLVNNDCRTE